MTDDFISRVVDKKNQIDKENLEIAEMFALARNNAESLYQLVNSYADSIEENGVSLDRTKYLVIELTSVLLKVSLEKGWHVEILFKDSKHETLLVGRIRLRQIANLDDCESLSLKAGRETQGIKGFRHKKWLLKLFIDDMMLVSDFAQLIEDEFIFQLDELYVRDKWNPML